MTTARKLLFLPPLLVGALLLALAVTRESKPGKKPPSEAVRSLRVLEAPRADVVPRVLGYGTARPGRVWRAVAQVSGRVTGLHTELQPGGRAREGEALVHIDSSTYLLAKRRLEAEIAQAQAQLTELSAREVSLRESERIERQALALAERDLKRTRDMGETASRRDVEQAERSALGQRQSLQSVQSQLVVLPSQRQALEATLTVKRVSLEQAELDLKDTVLRAPFGCRIADVQLEVGQFVKAGEVLFEGHGVDRTEVEAQVPLDQARRLFGAEGPQVSLAELDSATLRRVLPLQATVRFRTGDFEASWKGSLEGVRERIDQATRTVSFVVAVADPYGKAVPGKRPPLVPGMFCEVELAGPPLRGRWIVPRGAVREGTLYVLDAASRLRGLQVGVEFSQADLTVLRTELELGTRVVLSDPTPAIEGLLVSPQPAGEELSELLEQASGQGALR